jgi:hypothetical protein
MFIVIAIGVNWYGLLPKLVKNETKIRATICNPAVNAAKTISCLLTHKCIFSIRKMYSAIIIRRLQQTDGTMYDIKPLNLKKVKNMYMATTRVSTEIFLTFSMCNFATRDFSDLF